jgi:hypothetical protein
MTTLYCVVSSFSSLLMRNSLIEISDNDARSA